ALRTLTPGSPTSSVRITASSTPPSSVVASPTELRQFLHDVEQDAREMNRQVADVVADFTRTMTSAHQAQA
ncbi:hypothetical protein BGZ58_001635, partial [Dissophora ornata]